MEIVYCNWEHRFRSKKGEALNIYKPFLIRCFVAEILSILCCLFLCERKHNYACDSLHLLRTN